MFVISLFTVTLFLIARGILTLVQRYLDARGAGRSFKRMLKQGRIDAGIYADAIWTEASSFGRTKLRPKISRTQQRVIRDARRALREDFLNDYAPGFYQYIIIFLIASVLGLILETVYMYTMYGVLESRVGLVWVPFSPLYGFGAVLLTAVLWPIRNEPIWKIFVISAAVGGTLEQLAGWGMETIMHAWHVVVPAFPRSHHAVGCVALPHHVGRARTCMVHSFIMPEMLFRIGEPTTRRQGIVVGLLTAFIVLDIAITVLCFYRAGKRQEGVPPRNPIEHYIDDHFGDEFISDTFENLNLDRDKLPRTE